MNSYVLLSFFFLISFTSTSISQTASEYLEEVIEGSYNGVCESITVNGESRVTKYTIEIKSRLVIFTAVFDDGEVIRQSGEYLFMKDSKIDRGQIKVTFSDNSIALINFVNLYNGTAVGDYYLSLDKTYCYPNSVMLFRNN